MLTIANIASRIDHDVRSSQLTTTLEAFSVYLIFLSGHTPLI